MQNTNPKKRARFSKTVALSVVITAAGLSDANTDYDLDVMRQSQMSVSRTSQSKKLDPDDYPFVVVDIETTGFSPSRDRIIEIGAVRCDWRNSSESQTKFSRLIKSTTNIPRRIRELTGITNELVEQDGVPFETALKELDQFVGDCRIVGYNCSFDRGFLAPLADQLGLAFVSNTWVDAASMARKVVPKSQVADYRLPTMTQHFGVSGSTHRALADAQATAEIYKRVFLACGTDAELPPKRSSGDDEWLDRESSSEEFGLDLTGEQVVFTGFRDQILESRIQNAGGIVKGGISKKVSLLLVNDKTASPTGKFKKALEYEIEIESKDDFKQRFYVFY